MAPARKNPVKSDLNGHVLRLGIDLGTGKIQIDGQHIQGALTADDAEIKPVCLKNDQSARIEQTAILPEEGDVIYGTVDVEDAIAVNPALQDKVLELWKLSLHPEFQDLDEVKHVIKTLWAQRDRCAVQEFIADQLKCILQDIRNFYKNNNLNAGKDATYWDRIPLELQISVPAMWGDDQRGVIRNAACDAVGKDSGPPKVELREEPLCVATVYMLSLANSKSIQEGESLLLVDCGKGTLDIATVKLLRAPSNNGTAMQLQRIGPCSGNGAGSHTVNTQAWKWLLSGNCEEVQDLDERCAQLGTTRREFLRQFSKEIDRIKSDIHSTLHGASVTIRSSHGEAKPGRIPRLSIELPKDLIMSWYTTWTNSAIQVLKQHLDSRGGERFRCASLTGGGCLSTIFRRAVEAVLNQYNIKIGTPTASISPCSQGALLQHYFQEDKLPALANFYLAMTEEYDPDLHKGLTFESSEYDSGTKVLHERLRRIMSYKNGKFSGEEKVPLTFLVESDTNVRIHVDLYYSEQDFEEHTALRGADGNLRPGIRSYPLAHIDLDNLRNHRFKEIKGGKDGVNHFELKTYVQMTGSSEKLDLTVYCMKHTYHYTRIFNNRSVLFTNTSEVWNKSSSHFVRSITGTETKAEIEQKAGVKRKAGALPKVKRSPSARKGRKLGSEEDFEM
jgi:hypothetical protein